MGTYINIGNAGFQSARNSEYVDKSGAKVIAFELKYNKDANSAIDQIKRKQYPEKVVQYTNNLLLVGINYDKQQKKHECVIERHQKPLQQFP